jgi:hypothetical protein
VKGKGLGQWGFFSIINEEAMSIKQPVVDFEGNELTAGDIIVGVVTGQMIRGRVLEPRMPTLNSVLIKRGPAEPSEATAAEDIMHL